MLGHILSHPEPPAGCRLDTPAFYGQNRTGNQAAKENYGGQSPRDEQNKARV